VRHILVPPKKPVEEWRDPFMNLLKFYQLFTGEERRILFIFDDFHFCRSRVIELDMTENRIFTLCLMITKIS
jgi:hypothetical protein